VQNSHQKKYHYRAMYTAIQSDSQSKLYSTAHRTLWNTLGQVRGGTLPIYLLKHDWMNQLNMYISIQDGYVYMYSVQLTYDRDYFNLSERLGSLVSWGFTLLPLSLPPERKCACMYTPSSSSRQRQITSWPACCISSTPVQLLHVYTSQTRVFYVH